MARVATVEHEESDREHHHRSRYPLIEAETTDHVGRVDSQSLYPEASKKVTCEVNDEQSARFQRHSPFELKQQQTQR